MKKWLLYFFVFLLINLFVPLAGRFLPEAETEPEISVCSDGEIYNMSTEEYTLRILLAYGDVCKTEEAKKAFAVSARSCARYLSLFGSKHSDFDVCTQPDCCIPLGDPETAEKEVLELSRKAVEDTYGEYLSLEHMPAMALFTRCAGSATRECSEYPYLSPKSEGAQCEIHTFEKIIPYIEGIDKDSQAVAVYDDNGKCEFAIFGNEYFTGDEFAKRFGLPSSEFTLTLCEDGISAKSNGIGHGYGINLCKTDALAEKGFKYDDILEIYFPKLVLDNN